MFLFSLYSFLCGNHLSVLGGGIQLGRVLSADPPDPCTGLLRVCWAILPIIIITIFTIIIIITIYCKSQLCSLFTSGLALGSAGCRSSFVVCRLSSPCPKYLINPYNAIFFKSQGSKDIKNDILDCQIHKYTNTNTQIHKYTNMTK